MQHISRGIVSTCRIVCRAQNGIGSRSVSTAASKKGPKTLFVSSVWPQKNASGGGLRTGSLIQVLKENHFDIECVSPSKPNEFKDKLEQLVPTYQCDPNSSEFDVYLQRAQPELVIYDRFVMEEQFSWRVKKLLPHATHIVDTQDLHFLRVSRQEANTKGLPIKEITDIANPILGNMTAESGSAEGIFLREIASLYRTDGTIVVSSAEADRLRTILGNEFVDQRVSLVPFFYPPVDQSAASAQLGSNFFMIGNFRHPPNLDSFKWTRELWPLIRKQLPHAELHIYGAYPPGDVMNMTSAKHGFVVKGFLKEDSIKRLGAYRVNLAPLRFGAGVKTKIVDGWAAHVPCVTTSIGAEGMNDGNGFGGLVGDTNQAFVDAAVNLYLDPVLNRQMRQRGTDLVNTLYSRQVNEPKLLAFIHKIMGATPQRRSTDVIGNMLWYHMNRSTEFFSKYIELKSSLPKK